MCICFPDTAPNCLHYFLSEPSRQALSTELTKNIASRASLLAARLITRVMDEDATVIFVNGKIYTMDQDGLVVEALAVKGREIVKLGTNQEVLGFRGQRTEVVDLRGRVMLPGFIDPHVHMTFCMLDRWLDLGPFTNKSAEDARDHLIQAVKEHKNPNELLTAQLYDPTTMKGDFDVSKAGLDKISQDIGIFILEANGHVAHVNSKALKLAKVNKDTEDPPHGRFIRDLDGQPTGEVQELAIGHFKTLFNHVTKQQYRENFIKFLSKCAEKGCTSLHDCGIGFMDPEADLSILYSVFNEDNPPIRYSGFLVSTGWKTWEKHKMVPSLKDDDLRITGIKYWVDGSTQGGSAFLRQDYTLTKWGKGKPNYTQEDLENSIKKSHEGDWQVGVHTNGDAAIDMVLDCFESIQKSNPKPNLRHRIEHSTICHLEQLKRMKELYVSPSFLIGHIYYYGEVFEKILGEERARKMDPLKSAFDMGLKPTIHSDYNCQPVNPLRCICNAVTRKAKISGKVINEKEFVTPYQAIQAMTINAAWQCHKEDIVGSLQQGKLADFVILEQDPMKVDPEHIIDIKVYQTWKDGKITYQNEK